MSHRIVLLKTCLRGFSARALVFALLLGGTLSNVNLASAALLGFDTGTYPRITYNNQGTNSYDAGSDVFSLDATALVYINGGFGATCPPFDALCVVQKNTNGDQDVTIRIEVDDTGALTGGVPGDDLIVTGAVDVNGDNVIDFDGVLITGEVLQFGFEDTNPPPSTSLDKFDFRFQVTGGLLNVAGIFLGQDIGLTLGPEISTFGGSFQVSFDGTQVKGAVFPIPLECVELEKQVSVIPLADLKASGDLFVDDPTIWFDADTFGTGPSTELAATYRLVVENCGTVLLTDVHLEDVQPSSLPPGFETVLFNVNIGDLLVGEQKVIVSSKVGFPNVVSTVNGGNPTGTFIKGFDDLDAPERCLDPAMEIPNVPEGKLLNTARASTPGGGKDEDPAWVMCTPDIELKKQVSVIPLADLKASGDLFVDDPTIWSDADTFGDGPMTELGATYRLVVKNTGMVRLTNVTLDDVQPSSSPSGSETIKFENVNIGDLAVGEQKVIVSSKVGSPNVVSTVDGGNPTGTFIDGFDELDAPERCLDPAVRIPGVPSGKLLNTARVTTDQGPMDDNPAWVMCPPDIELKKQVSVIPLADLKASGDLFVDDPNIWFDADTFGDGPMTELGATYRLVVKNTGSIRLTDVRLDDVQPSSSPSGSETIKFENVSIGVLEVGEQKVIVSSKVGFPNVVNDKGVEQFIDGFKDLDAPERCLDPADPIPGVPNGKLLNTARVSTDEGPSDENPAWVMCQPDIELKKQVSVKSLAELKERGELFVDDPKIWSDADTFGDGPTTELGATYRLVVKNTGVVKLTNVTLEDVQPSSLPPNFETIVFNVNIGDLEVGEQKVIVTSKVGLPNVVNDKGVEQFINGFDDLDAPERCLDHADPIPGVPNGKLLNTARVSTDQGPTDDNPAWVMCQPMCEISVEKTCIIPEPVSTLTAKCSGKIQEFTLAWPHGPVTLTQVGDLTFSASQVQPGDEITFFNGSDDNDVFVQVNGSGFDGQSVFHMSCSDEDMNADNDNKAQQQLPGETQDCGKFQGNAKHNDDQSFINAWTFEGLVDADGEVLDCTPPEPSPGDETCELIRSGPVGCGFDGDELNPDTLTWRYTGGGCAASKNGQIGATGDWSCNSSPSSIPNPPPAQVTVTDDKGGSHTVGLGETFTIARDASKELMLSAPGYSETVTMHTSCSKPLIAGEIFGSFTLSALDGQTAGTEVIYSYEITNLGNTDVTLNSVFDDKLKELLVPSPQLLPAGAAPLVITKPASVDETTTNIVNVYGNVDGFDGAMCDATDTVTVTVEIPPDPPLTGKCSGKLKEVVVYWNGTQTIDVSPGDGADRLSAAQVGPDQPLIIYPDGSTNDVFVNISGAGISGHSKFHVSCSDDDMNADNNDDAQPQIAGYAQDCGKFQGNAKDNDKPEFINTWLLEGMLDADDLRLTCNFDPADAPAALASGAVSHGGVVTAKSTLELSDDAVKWELENTGTSDVHITEVLVTWPAQHGLLKEMKLDGSFVKDLFDGPPSTFVEEGTGVFKDDGAPDERVLKDGDKKKLEIKFTQKYKDGKSASQFSITVKFSNDQVLSISP